MPDNLHYIHGVWLLSRMPDDLLFKHGSHCQLDEQPGSRVDDQQQRQTKEEKGKGQIKKTNRNFTRSHTRKPILSRRHEIINKI